MKSEDMVGKMSFDAEETAQEAKLLEAGVFSMDGLEGMTLARAVEVAKHSVRRADGHYRAAAEAGLFDGR